MEEAKLLPPEKKRRTDEDTDEEMAVEASTNRGGSSHEAPPPVELNVNTIADIENSLFDMANVVTPPNDWDPPKNAETEESRRSHDFFHHSSREGDAPQHEEGEEEIIVQEPSNDDDEEGVVIEERALDWDAIRQHPDTRERVEQYWNSKHRREQAQDRFNAMLDEIDAACSKCIDMVLEAAGHVHQTQRQDVLDAMEAELLQLFVGNDRMRTQMKRDLERSSKQWQYSLFNLMASLHGSGSEGSTMESTDPEAGATEDDPEGQEEVPDWEGMIQRHPPAADGIRRFLASREQLESIDNAFERALDEINMALKANMGVLMETAIRIHEEHAQTLDAMEDQLLDHFEYNHQQRTWMQHTLEESAQTAQRHFTNLMSILQQHDTPPPEQHEERAAMPTHTAAATKQAW